MFSRAWRLLPVFALNSDWFVALFTPVVIGQSNFFGLVLRHSIENRPIYILLTSYVAFQLGNDKKTGEKVESKMMTYN